MKKILLPAAFLVVVLTVLTACDNSPIRIDAAQQNKNAAPKTDAHEHADDVPRITLADAKKEFDAGNAVFVDTRGESAYKNEHIKGAVNVSTETFEQRYKEIPTGKKIIAYCSCPAENTSGEVVKKLKEKGVTNAYALIGGTNAWKSAGYPMESSAEKPK